MSETGRERDGLDSALRVLAAGAEARPSLSGAQIRRRGEIRGRRRRVAGATAAALALFAGVAVGLPQLLGADEARQLPAAVPPSPSVSVRAPAATIERGTGTLTVTKDVVQPRSIVVVLGKVAPGRLTVVSKSPKRRVPAETIGLGDTYMLNASWVVELSRPDGTTMFAIQSPSNKNFSRSAIGVGSLDAKWLYDQLAVGDVIALS
ncbi:hypothetical protein ACFYRC_15025 [Streptomyces sp. NPDC005279]|uniref:hypothetical protein n=1 Tax=Streptomyces sp. NPDC005279 TaxID=3364712 RepID=UPI003684FBEF